MLAHTVPFLGFSPPTLALSSVTQPKTHVDSLPSPVVILQAPPFCRKPILHSLPTYCWNAFAHLPVVTCWSDQATHPLRGRGAAVTVMRLCLLRHSVHLDDLQRIFLPVSQFSLLRYYYFNMNVYQVTIKVPGEEQEAAQLCLWCNAWSDARLIVGTQKGLTLNCFHPVTPTIRCWLEMLTGDAHLRKTVHTTFCLKKGISNMTTWSVVSITVNSLKIELLVSRWKLFLPL